MQIHLKQRFSQKSTRINNSNQAKLLKSSARTSVLYMRGASYPLGDAWLGKNRATLSPKSGTSVK